MLNLKLADLYADLVMRTARYDATYKKVKAQLDALVAKKYAIDVNVGTARIDAAMAKIRAFRAAASGPITVRLSVNSGPGLARAIAGVKSTKQQLATPVRIPIAANARPFWREALRITKFLDRLKRRTVSTVELELHDEVATAKVRALRDRIRQIKAESRVNLQAAGGGPRGGGSGGGGGYRGGGGFGAGLASGAGLPLYGGPEMMAGELVARGAKEVVTTAADVEVTMARIGHAAALADDELKRLKENLLGIAASRPGASTRELLDATLIGAKQGEKGVEGLTKFAAGIIAIRNAVGEGVPIEALSNQLKRTLETFDLGSDSIRGLGSALVMLDNQSTANAAEILNVTQRMSAAAHKLGITPTQTMGIATTFIERGLTPETAGTAGGQILSKMASDRENFAAQLQIDPADFANHIRVDPMGALTKVLRRLDSLDPLKQLDVTEELGLKGQRVKGGFLQLAGDVENIGPRVAAADDEWKSGAALDKMVEALSTTTTAKFQELSNTATATAETLGRQFKPATDAAAEALTRFLQVVNRGIGGLKPGDKPPDASWRGPMSGAAGFAAMAKGEFDKAGAIPASPPPPAPAPPLRFDKRFLVQDARPNWLAALGDPKQMAKVLEDAKGAVEAPAPARPPAWNEAQQMFGRAFAFGNVLGMGGMFPPGRLKNLAGPITEIAAGDPPDWSAGRLKGPKLPQAPKLKETHYTVHSSGLEFGRRMQEDILNSRNTEQEQLKQLEKIGRSAEVIAANTGKAGATAALAVLGK